MHKESFKTQLFSSTWRISVAHGRIHVILYVTCLNVILNRSTTIQARIQLLAKGEVVKIMENNVFFAASSKC